MIDKNPLYKNDSKNKNKITPIYYIFYIELILNKIMRCCDSNTQHLIV